jgi:hypothetical protein
MLASLLTLLVAGLAAPTDFGVREVGGFKAPAVRAAATATRPTLWSAVHRRFSLPSALRLAARFGRITSTVRSREHNRRVGGAANSWHLHGRALDIARQPGVSHAEIAAELRRRGFSLIESLDEGDHSHFAFADGPVAPALRRSSAQQIAEARQEGSYFRFVDAPRSVRTAERDPLP